MSIEVKVPVLPESVSDATIATWHKKPGDAVKRDENLDDWHILEVADVGKPNFFRHACLSIGPRSQKYAPHVLQEAREMAHEASGRSAVDHPVIVR